MADEFDLAKLRAALELARAERDAAQSALEARERQSEEQSRLLMEEQDRFVSRLLGSQERDLGKLRLELEEARTTAARLEQKLLRDRQGSERLEEELAKARVDIDRLREQRDSARAEVKRSRDGHATMCARIDQLEGNLALARTMLDDAMGDGSITTGFTSARPPISTHRRLKPETIRESGIRRPHHGATLSYPPGLAPPERSLRKDTPRPAAALSAAMRSRPPR